MGGQGKVDFTVVFVERPLKMVGFLERNIVTWAYVSIQFIPY